MRPVMINKHERLDNGLYGHMVKKCSYVATLCRIGGDDVMAVRMEYYQNKFDVRKEIDRQYPDWKVKTISKLYEEDFEEEQRYEHEDQ